MHEDRGAAPVECARWTAARRECFFNTLAATGDVDAATARAGVSHAMVHAAHRRDAVFARGWARALDAGYRLLETLLVGQALREKGAPATFDVDLALRVLANRKNIVPARTAGTAATDHRVGRDAARDVGTVADSAATDQAILKKLDAYERRRRAEASGA